MKPTLEAAVRAGCRVHGLTEYELFKYNDSTNMMFKTRRYTRAREQILFVVREVTGASYPELADHMGYRCHSSVLGAVRRATERMGDARYAAEVAELRRGMTNADAVLAEGGE